MARAVEGLGRVAWDTGAVESARRHWSRAVEKFDALGLSDAERLRAPNSSSFVQLRPDPS
ncbi:MAG: hypothetical protein ABIQ18_41055 [Umezawaea sp.]